MVIESRRFGGWRLVMAPRRETFNGPMGLFAGPDGLVRPGIPAHAERLEGFADPGALVFLRLQAARLHQAISVLVPAAIGEIVPEHGGRGLRLEHDAERHVA